MPVNRADRNDLRLVMAQLMRGELELESGSTNSRVEKLMESDDQVVRELARTVHPNHHHGLWNTEGVVVNRWIRWQRELAFLATDRESYAKYPEIPGQNGWPDMTRWQARLVLLSVGIGLSLFPWFGVWPLIVFWLVPGAVIFIGPVLAETGARLFSKQLRQQFDSYPFDNEIDWSENRILLDDLNLPERYPTERAREANLAKRVLSGFGVLLAIGWTWLFLACGLCFIMLVWIGFMPLVLIGPAFFEPEVK